MENEGVRATLRPFPLNEARLALLSLATVVEEDPYEQEMPEGCFARPSMEYLFQSVGLENWCMDPVVISDLQRQLQIWGKVSLLGYPACERRGSVLPFRPRPRGVDTEEVESLVGYFLRLTEANQLAADSLARFVWSGCPAGHIRHFGGAVALQAEGADQVFNLEPLESALRMPRRALYRHTLLPMGRQFFPGMASGSDLRRFFEKSECKVCPRCFAEPNPYYRLIWNLHEVTTCLRHAVYLINRCQKCRTPLSSLSDRSIFGRCEECRTPFSKAKPVLALEADLAHQRRIIDDYAALLKRGAGIDGNHPSFAWGRRLRAVRVSRNLSAEDIAEYLGVSLSSVIATECGQEEPTCFNLLTWIRHISGSMQAFLESRDCLRDGLSDTRICEGWICNSLYCPWFRCFRRSDKREHCPKCLDRSWE